MNLPTFEQFEQDALARGFTEVLERRWAAGTVLDTHSHPFSVDAIVVDGEMWLTVGDQVMHLCAGDRFTLQEQVPHAERYGDNGAAYWVARRQP